MPPKDCHERALGLLAVRPRTRWELQQRLGRAGFDSEEVADVLARLERVGLIDDRAFAEQFAQQLFGAKRAGARAVASGLRAKGVSPELVAAVTDQGSGEEESRAHDLAASYAAKLGQLEPAKAFSRLNSLLLRRGYPADLARSAARSALRPRADQGDTLAASPLRP